MGLADLKKNDLLCKSKTSHSITIEAFIEAANLYASGKTAEFDIYQTDSNIQSTNVVDFMRHQDTRKRSTAEVVLDLNSKTKLDKQSANSVKKPFKRATFTLSEDIIAQLTALSNSSKTAKSKLIRQLVNQHFSLSPAQQRKIERLINID